MAEGKRLGDVPSMFLTIGTVSKHRARVSLKITWLISFVILAPLFFFLFSIPSKLLALLRGKSNAI